MSTLWAISSTLHLHSHSSFFRPGDKDGCANLPVAWAAFGFRAV